MRIALAQLNPTVGDIDGNMELVLHAIEQARSQGAQLLVTSELALIGYPPRDLLQREGVVEACEVAVQKIADAADELHVIVGHPRQVEGGVRPFRNSASVCQQGRIIAVCDKQLLPGYDVFDEDRYFEPGAESLVVAMHGHRVGILICEDLWRAKDVSAKRKYAVEPIAECIGKGCDLVISLNASPFVVGKWQLHLNQLRQIARDHRVPVVAVNQVGANDDLIFDGRSVVMSHDGALSAVLPAFEPAVVMVDLRETHMRESVNLNEVASRWQEVEREIFFALSLGVRDYLRKTGHRDALIGLSGGIDSALVATIAVHALGPQHVHGIMMPSMYSSAGSINDARDLATRLRLASCKEISIQQAHQTMRQTLASALETTCAGITDENVQARLRGILLMAISNSSQRSLVLSTSNKSEIATGYSTLYGDMCGAVAVLGDLTKTRIYDLANWINGNFEELGFQQPPIPESSISKPPSAELRPNQTDQDTLPPYEVLDQIVEAYIEREQSAETIIAETGFDAALVNRVVLLIDRAQYKRDQAPVVLKLTPRAFGPGRPMPIVMKDSRKVTGDDQQPVGHAAPATTSLRGQQSQI